MTPPLPDRIAAAIDAYAQKSVACGSRYETGPIAARTTACALIAEIVAERDAATKRADGLRTDLAAAQAKLAEAVQLLSYCRPRVQSYEECNETYCADGQDHEIRKRIEAFLAAAEQGGA